MEKDNSFLATQPVGKLIFKLAVPAVAAQLINMLYNIVDRIYIGHIAGSGALALTGVGVCMPVILIVSAFAALVSMGGAPRASIAMGSGDNESAERTLGACFALQIVISALLTAVLLIWSRPLLLCFGASVNTIDYAQGYLQVYALGTVFVQLTLGMNAFITAQGFARTGMLTVLIGAVCNIALDPLFIFGLGMGVRGAALATIISQAVSTVWVVLFLSSRKSILRLSRKNIRLDIKTVAPCMALGVAPFIMQASESVLAVCFNSSLLKYGGDIAVGAMTILTSVMQFSMLPTHGIAQGAQPVTSYNFGAGNAGRVRRSFMLLLRANVTYTFIIWAAVMLAPQLFAGIFTADAELIAFTARALRIYAAAMLLMGAQTACQMTFISIGNAAASVVVAVVRKFVLLIPLIYIMPLLMSDKTSAVYMAEPVADTLAVIFTVILFSLQFRRALRGLEPAADKAVDSAAPL